MTETETKPPRIGVFVCHCCHNIAGVVESGSTPGWYTITATAGDGSASSRTFTGPIGWSIDTSDVLIIPNFIASANDISISHPTGLDFVDCKVWSVGSIDSSNSLLNGSVAWSFLRQTQDNTYLQIRGIATVAVPLIIYVKLI